MLKSLAAVMEVDDELPFDGELSLFMNDSTPDSEHYLDRLAAAIKAVCLEWPKLEPRLPAVAGHVWRVWTESGNQPGQKTFTLASVAYASLADLSSEMLADPNNSVVRICAHFDSAPLVVFVSSRSSEVGGRILVLLSNLILQGTLAGSLMRH